MDMNPTRYKGRTGQRYTKTVLGWILAVGLLVSSVTPATWAQTTQLPALGLKTIEKSLQSILAARDVEVSTSRVVLDGDTLFVIAAPAIKMDSNKSDSPTPIALRRQAIEQQLDRIANGNINPKTLAVTSTQDQTSGLPVLAVNGQYLMTVTELDAQLRSSTPQQWASELTSVVRTALLKAYRERQPRFLIRQGVVGGSIIVTLLLLSRLFARRYRYLKAQRRQLNAKEIKAGAVKAEERKALRDQEISGPQEPAVFLETSAEVTSTTLAHQQHRNLLDLRLRILRIAQVVLWGCGTFTILGLFPQMRWLRPFLLSTPLQLLGIGLSIYVLTRLSDVLVDRLFESIQSNEFISPETSQRVALRVSTVARVVKSTASLLWVGAGLLAGLSLLGVNLLPLLAGAGIIGLALSFAAQSVIKDVINGFLILLEDQYAVGDVIAVGNVGGLVENMNLRITQLRNSEGMLITIPNSQISTVQNLSQGWSRVDLTVRLGLDADPDAALQALKQLAEELYADRQWRPKLLDPPEILGIEALDHTGMSIRIWIKTQPLQQWIIAREFRRRLKKLMMAEVGLSIGIPQQSLWFNQNTEIPSSD